MASLLEEFEVCLLSFSFIEKKRNKFAEIMCCNYQGCEERGLAGRLSLDQHLLPPTMCCVSCTVPFALQCIMVHWDTILVQQITVRAYQMLLLPLQSDALRRLAELVLRDAARGPCPPIFNATAYSTIKLHILCKTISLAIFLNHLWDDWLKFHIDHQYFAQN